MIMAGVAAALILMLVVLPGLLFGGDDAADENAFPPPSSVPATVPSGPPPEETFEPFSAKNPFRPLVVLVADEGAPPADDTSTTSTVPPLEDLDGDGFPDLPDDGSGDGGFDDGAGDGGTGTTATTAPPPPARTPDRVGLLEVYTNPDGRAIASIRVNDTTYQVGEGEDFAVRYRVLDLDITTRCGQFLFGDDRFSLCEDDEVLK
jgi:hypothetical protein